MGKNRLLLSEIKNEFLKKQIMEQLGGDSCQNLPSQKSTNKFNAKRVEYDGVVYDSKKEGNFARTLDILKGITDESKRVLKYERQVRFDIIINEVNCGYYLLDFKVYYFNGDVKHIDIKGIRTGCSYQMFRLKKKLVQALYNIIIEEI